MQQCLFITAAITKSFSQENERIIHEHLCSLEIPVGKKAFCPHCNVHFASYAYLEALQLLHPYSNKRK
jgi:hypothetical protein